MTDLIGENLFKKNDLVEMESGSRLYVSGMDNHNMVRLSLKPDGTVVAQSPSSELRLVKPTKFVWLMMKSGEFSDSWEVDGNDTTNPEKLLSDIEQYPHLFADNKPKLIEFRCHNDDSFEFLNLMKLR